MTGRERGGTPAGGEPVGLYLHIPFCRSKCPFCDFCSFPRPDAAMVEAYVDELIRRIRLSGAAEAAAAGGVQALDTVYIGGGFFMNALYVALGELAVLLTFGTALFYAVKKRHLDTKVFGG